MFQRVGASAYKAGLDTSIALDTYFHHPHHAFKCIHIAGTNGKGSTSHLLAAILQCQGYKVGLYTSPHLVDFRERIRVNGEMIAKDAVVDFVDQFRNSGYEGRPSFFELTMMMAFDYFRRREVDYAVIEVGMGGRLDSTNIISPILSLITNISFDHTQFLGDTLPKIAAEKAGIIKKGVPVVISEAEGDVRQVFEAKAAETGAPITFARDTDVLAEAHVENAMLNLNTRDFGTLRYQLTGDCQEHNARAVLAALPILRQQCGVEISDEAVAKAFENVCSLTGLMGRWMTVCHAPLTICDTGHNVGGMQYIVAQLSRLQCDRLHIIFGCVNDKDISHILDMMPQSATYYFTQASIPRALPCHEVKEIAASHHLHGNAYPTVAAAYAAATAAAAPTDAIFIGGSTFVVADFLSI